MPADAAGSDKPLCGRLRWSDLDEGHLERLIGLARDEDLGGAGLAAGPAKAGDVTTETLIPGKSGRARLVAREALRVCGIPLVPLVLKAYNPHNPPDIETRVTDGQLVDPGGEIAVLRGDLATLLTAERVLLNFLQHLSGIATHTRRHVEDLGDSKTRLLDTRKTTPAFRVLEKYAVACGGGWNHRIGLFDRMMIKDNHLAAGGAALMERIRKIAGERPDLVVEIEVDRPEQIPFAIEAGADVILLDNFNAAQLKASVSEIGGKCATEASGGIHLDNLPELGQLGLDFISCGALTHQSTWRDIGLDWEE